MLRPAPPIRTAYAKKKGLEDNSFRLVFDGKRLPNDETPAMVSGIMSIWTDGGDTVR